MFLHLVKKILNTMNQTQSKVCDAIQIYEIKIKISFTKQEDNPSTNTPINYMISGKRRIISNVFKVKCNKDVALRKKSAKKTNL